MFSKDFWQVLQQFHIQTPCLDNNNNIVGQILGIYNSLTVLYDGRLLRGLLWKASFKSGLRHAKDMVKNQGYRFTVEEWQWFGRTMNIISFAMNNIDQSHFMVKAYMLSNSLD